ncbi:hypothetical protein J8N05_46715 (plasmid) [Streptomyces sp. BH-SS-21]|uniref:Uncharacterized protein n=1 Tax=Streptomyces liliiviolaceus TaxID=2823109 RepID=A0A941B9H3_9ACTN|nr:hypothetical protein [Streptomyces liliiviolaceus]MBQ0855655.1 hypothetical protein [Streptomyces liliiviolaceus]
MSPPPAAPGPGPLLSPRALLILLAAVVIGAIVGVLTFFSAGSAAGAILAGLCGSGASIMGLHLLIGP